MSRRKGTVDDGRPYNAGAELFLEVPGVVVLRYPELEWRSFKLVLAFQRGRFGMVDGCGICEVLRPAGVGVTGAVGLGIDDLRPVMVAVTCGKPDSRRTFDMVERVVALPTELSRRLELPMGVLYPLPLMTTDEAGELPGVSIALPVAGLSIVMILEMESRNCWPLTMCTSSREASITRRLALRASVREVMSDKSRSTSPFTVKRSLTPF
jgi:hypothetical protein